MRGSPSKSSSGHLRQLRGALPRAEPAPGAKRVAVARVRRPWGVDGSISVTPYADDPSALVPGAKVLAGDASYTVSAVKRAGSGLTLTFVEISRPEEAENLRGVDLEVLETDVPAAPPGVYYHYQIIGALVVTLQGKTLGRVSEILETPANDVYVVRPESGGADVLLPAVAGVIREVDTEAGVIKADPPEGMN